MVVTDTGGAAIVGAEVAVYDRGTNRKTWRHEFRKIPVLDTNEQAVIRAGHADVHLPEDTMHSFESEHNRIRWSLRVRGYVPMFPDVTQTGEITILPQLVDLTENKR